MWGCNGGEEVGTPRIPSHGSLGSTTVRLFEEEPLNRAEETQKDEGLYGGKRWMRG